VLRWTVGAIDTWLSLGGFALEAAAVVVWYYMFASHWRDWDLWAENMLVFMPN
jgi:hypothetical protein